MPTEETKRICPTTNYLKYTARSSQSELGRLTHKRMAERRGFEPRVDFRLHTLSKRARSTAPASLLNFALYFITLKASVNNL